MLRVLGLVLLLMATLACQQQPIEVATTVPIPTVTTATQPAQPTTTGTTVIAGEQNGCFGAEPPMIGDGFLGRFDSEDSDSSAIAGFNWSETGECAALTVSFRSEAGAPAVDPPGFRAEYLRHTAIVRLELEPGVADSAVSEQALDTDLFRAGYVALDPEAGALVVDIHVATGADVRVRPASSPARIIVEVEGDQTPVAGTATVGEAVVLFAPASTSPPLLVQGYGRSGLEISATFVSSTRVIEDAIPLEPSPTRWTTFEWTIRDFQPGPVSVRVGDAAPLEFVSR